MIDEAVNSLLPLRRHGKLGLTNGTTVHLLVWA